MLKYFDVIRLFAFKETLFKAKTNRRALKIISKTKDIKAKLKI